MRTNAIPLVLLAVILGGCTGELPTAASTGGHVTARRVFSNRAAVPFRGTVDQASHTASYDLATNTGQIHLVGTGTATHLGRFTLVSDLALNLATITGSERMTLTAANGDMIFATGTVEGTPAEDGRSLESLESLTITGGTGRFAGATGSFTLRQVNLAPDRFSSGSFDGTILLDR